MKIRFILSNFYPEEIALTNRIGALLPLLAAHHQVDVIFLSKPGVPFDEDVARKKLDGVRVNLIAVSANSYDRGRFLVRFCVESFNCLRLWLTARTHPAQLTWVSVPQLSLLPVSALFIPFSKGTSLLELRDLTWESIPFGPGLLGRCLRNVVEKVAIFSISRFDKVVTCTEAQADFVRQHTRVPASVVRNGIALNRFDRLAGLRPKAPGSGPFTVTYVGNVGYAQNLMTLAKTARLMSGIPSLRFVIVGDGLDLTKLREFAAEARLRNLILVGRVSWTDTIQFYEQSDVLYAQLRSDPGLDKAEPSKLFEYLASGRPIIYAGRGLGRTLAGMFEQVRLIEPEDENLLAASVEWVRRQGYKISKMNRAVVRSGFIREDIFADFLRAEHLTGNDN